VISKRFLFLVVFWWCLWSSFRSFWLGGATGTTEDRKKVVIIFRALSLARARKNANSIDDARINSPRNDSHVLKYIFIRTKAWRKRRTSSQRGPSRCV
jgi:hypothetical protein